MSKKIDMIGKTFGKLKVIEEDVENKSKGSYWLCKCDCGNIVSVVGTNLRSGKTKSCGCLNKTKENLDGKKFGLLTVLKRIDNTKKVLCQCECGNKTEVYVSNLKKGLTRSCGCLQKKIVGEKLTHNLIGQVFGRLTVVEKAENIGASVAWKCVCECGNEVIVRAECLKNGSTKSCGCFKSEYSSKRFSLNLIGQKFGRLTVLERSGTIVGRDGSKYSYWKCMCDCGNETSVKGHDFKIGKVQSCGCLISKSEEEIRKILVDKYINFNTQYHFDDLKSDKGWVLKFDFALLDNNNSLIALIEYQGRQHFEPVDFSGKGYENSLLEFNELVYRDNLKREYCKNKNIPLYEITFKENIEGKLNYILFDINLKIA